MVVGFDFDGTLKGPKHFEQFIKIMAPMFNKGHALFLLTTRDKIDDEIIDHVQSLNLKISRKDMFAIGKKITNGMFDSKAHYIKSMNIPCSLFFDNDPYEIEDFRKFGVPVIWVPEMDKDSLMWEITDGFFEKRSNYGN